MEFTKVVVFALVALIISSLIFMACQQNKTNKNDTKAELTELQIRALNFTSPLPLPDFEQSSELIHLGKMLYYEPRLSKSGVISCHTCHNLATYGADLLPVSIGHGWQKGTFNSPTVLNASFHKSQFWDGRAEDVEEQAGMPILEMVEMASTEEHVLAVLSSIPQYVEHFKAAFPNQVTPLQYENVGKAIGAFERILITPSPFDQYLQGDKDALTAEQKQGLTIFIDSGCHTCHRGQVLGGELFAFFNTPAEKEAGIKHPGRFSFTYRESDKHFFKVPSLLNVAQTYPYLHDGSEYSLDRTISVIAKDMLNKEFTDEEIALVKSFLESLTGTIPEYALQIPVLPRSTPQTPRPGN